MGIQTKLSDSFYTKAFYTYGGTVLVKTWNHRIRRSMSYKLYDSSIEMILVVA